MMTVTVQDVMRQVRNHFAAGCVHERWQVRGGQTLQPERFRPGEWIAIPDGPLSGVWQLDEYGALPGAQDADWEGSILLLEPPGDFLQLCKEIAEWVRAHPDPTATTERFGEYSRSQTPGGWEQAFSAALAPYRRIFPEVRT